VVEMSDAAVAIDWEPFDMGAITLLTPMMSR
jgi:hypothetical protein